MNNKTIIRGAIILGVLILAILIPVALEAFTNNEKTPTLSNADDVYLTVDGVEITNGELWNTMRNVDGVTYLQDYVLEYLLADEIAAVTQDEIDAQIRYLTYLTEDEEQIAKIQEDEEIHQDYLDAFRQNVIVSGYDPDDSTSVRDFLALDIAKENYTKALIANAEDGDDYYISEIDVQEYYQDNTFGDVCSLDIRFSNSTEVKTVFNEFNLVLNYEGGIGEYIGALPIEQVLTFDDRVTIELTDDEVFPFYIKMYNLMNPWLDPIAEDTTKEEFCEDYADIAMKNYNDMTEFKATGHPMTDLATYLFDVLSTDELSVPYTYTNTKEFGDFTYMSYKIGQDDVAEFDTLTQAEKDALKDEMVENRASDTIISIEMDKLIEGANLEIFDPMLKLKYEFNNSVEFDNKGSDTLVASIDGKDITIDEFYNYMEGRIGVFYSLETIKGKLLLDSDNYTALYGESKDYFASNNEKMEEHVASLEEMKGLFGANYYANYGFSSATMTWEDFMYLAFSLESEASMMENMFIIPALQNEVMHDQIDYDDGVAYMQDQIDRYYSLNVNHVLIYFDFDYDFEPDDFEDYRDGLTVAEADELNLLLVDFRDLITEKVNDDELSFTEIVEEYNKTLLTDTSSDWAQFKAAGFFIKTEELGEIDQESGKALDDGFAEALKRIYDVYVDLDEDEAYNDDTLTFSQFGVHYISVTQGTNFVQLSAKFEDLDNDGDPENDNVMPSLEQVELYLEIKYAASRSENTTAMFHDNDTYEDIYDAVDYYYGPVYESYMAQTAFSAYLGQFILDNGTYGTDNAAKVAHLELLTQAFYDVNYPELFGAE